MKSIIKKSTKKVKKKKTVTKIIKNITESTVEKKCIIDNNSNVNISLLFTISRLRIMSTFRESAFCLEYALNLAFSQSQ